MKPPFAALALVPALFALARCHSTNDAEQCGAPADSTYQCTPIEAGAVGCVGGPLIGADVDSGVTYPSGCKAIFPYCSSAYPNEPEACECEPDQALDGGLGWVCPVSTK